MTSSEAHLRDLLLRGLAGDGAAYHAFLKALTAHLRAFLRKRLARNPDDVEDLLQETLLAVHTQRHTYDRNLPLTAWVHAIAKYKMVDALRRGAKHRHLTDPLDEYSEILAAVDHEAAETRRDLAKLLQLLPERQRQPIIEVKLYGVSVAETARAMGMSVSAVKVNVHRGLKALAVKVRGEG